jgi:hypothetical protein
VDIGPLGGCLVQPGPCVTLLDGRFRVQVDFAGTGQGSTVQPGDANGAQGQFWFFDNDNLALTLKVLNGCAINDRYWVFAGGLTDVQFRLTVDDTKGDGATQEYVPTPAAPIIDTDAFATCP